MVRIPCCEKENVKRGQWTVEEDNKLFSYITQHGTRNWRLIPKNAGLDRCGKSCRLRWINYLRPDLKRDQFSDLEEQTIVKFHSVVGNRSWSIIAAQLPGRTDNDVKNYWNTKLKKKLSSMGIDPVTHKPFSHLMAEIATTLAPPQESHVAEAALGCFKDEMLHLLMRKHLDVCHSQQSKFNSPLTYVPCVTRPHRLGESHNQEELHSMPANESFSDNLLASMPEIQSGSQYDNDCSMSLWGQSVCIPNMYPMGDYAGALHNKLTGEEQLPRNEGELSICGSHTLDMDYLLWDLASGSLMNRIV